ncbi:MAG: hypothetical protein H7A25_13500 [Leptospiraceae bacterium]|nr:hypothetical protein [Leptospiraceae bacterium]MCP5500917.1 hypothetical protein [Leptospiraceae bacterium]
MRKFLLLFISIFVLGLVACGPAPLKYSRVSTLGTFLSADVQQGSKRVMWFQMFDQVGNASVIDSYKTATQKVVDGKYPAKVSENNHIWLLVGNRFEIRLIADSKNKVFQNTKKLEEFLKSFDLAGLEGITQADKMASSLLEKYIPRLSKVSTRTTTKKRIRK